ncbi:MAG: hypothetical protein ACD_20C00236G0005 [uncultured bacterium]|nr:MAG: hypothetical protein ACD_20C00236G0005 [uncultured bacterium]HBH19115.1 nicotinate (nicotinamide) nucleotide adenylyltransferase [Cyanobacteria bacterium UBA9579]
MKLTVFSGTYNPIHTAHLIIAEAVRDELQLDKITFIPAYYPPHRDLDLASPEHRLNMVKIAIADNPYFEVNDIEYQRQEKSYTYFTIQELLDKNPEASGKINFIIGSDAFKLIDTWYEIENLAKLVNFVIVIRPDNMEIGKLLDNVKLSNFDFHIVKTPLLDISSSDIRRRIKQNKSIKYLVPKAVEEYIYDNNLYK